MAKRSLSFDNITPTATADATNLVDSTYFGLLQGGSSTQRVNISEVSIMGIQGGTTASPTIILLARDSTVGVTVSLSTGQNDASLDASTAALAAPTLAGSTASTKPQRSASLVLLTPSINALGGGYRWVAYPGEEISIIGNTASLGEVSLSAFTGGTPGACSSHMVYESY